MTLYVRDSNTCLDVNGSDILLSVFSLWDKRSLRGRDNERSVHFPTFGGRKARFSLKRRDARRVRKRKQVFKSIVIFDYRESLGCTPTLFYGECFTSKRASE